MKMGTKAEEHACTMASAAKKISKTVWFENEQKRSKHKQLEWKTGRGDSLQIIQARILMGSTVKTGAERYVAIIILMILPHRARVEWCDR